MTLEEFNDLVDTRPDLVAKMLESGIDIATAREMFSMLDVNDLGAINEGDFLGACLRITGNEEASNKDLYV